MGQSDDATPSASASIRVRGVVFSRSVLAIHLGGGRNEFSQESAPLLPSLRPPHPPLPAVNAGSPTAAERMTTTYANGLPLPSRPTKLLLLLLPPPHACGANVHGAVKSVGRVMA